MKPINEVLLEAVQQGRTIIILEKNDYLEYWSFLPQSIKDHYILNGFLKVQHLGHIFPGMSYRGIPVICNVSCVALTHKITLAEEAERDGVKLPGINL